MKIGQKFVKLSLDVNSRNRCIGDWQETSCHIYFAIASSGRPLSKLQSDLSAVSSLRSITETDDRQAFVYNTLIVEIVLSDVYRTSARQFDTKFSLCVVS